MCRLVLTNHKDCIPEIFKVSAFGYDWGRRFVLVARVDEKDAERVYYSAIYNHTIPRIPNSKSSK